MSAPPLWHRFTGPIDDASAATISFLRALNVAAAPRTVAGYVTAHPAYPSLAAIVDCLAELGVRASARRIAFDALSSVPGPALVHVREGAVGAFWLMNGYHDGRFSFTLPEGTTRSMPDDELGARYQGIVVTGVAEAGAGERYAARNALGDRLREARSLSVGLLLLAALFGSCGAACLASPGLTASSLAFCLAGWVGFGLSLYLSLRDHLDGSSLLGRLCRVGKAFDCSVVVQSDAGYIGGVVPVADVAAAFFMAQVLAGGAAALSGSSSAFLAVSLALGVVLIPVMAFSLVQQAFVIRRWCTLCLLVNTALLVQLVIAALSTRRGWSELGAVDARAAVVTAASALVGALSYAVVRSLVAPALAAPQLHGELERLRSLPEVLGGALARTPAVPTDVPGKLLEGAPAAPIELLVVSHPFCLACADAHAAMHRLVEAFPDLVRGVTIFSVPADDGPASSAARSLLEGELDITTWYTRAEQSVTDWLGRADHVRLAPGQNEVLAAQTELAERAGVSGTPAIFVDGRPLPPGFDLRHLRFYLRAEQRRLRSNHPKARETA